MGKAKKKILDVLSQGFSFFTFFYFRCRLFQVSKLISGGSTTKKKVSSSKNFLDDAEKALRKAIEGKDLVCWRAKYTHEFSGMENKNTIRGKGKMVDMLDDKKSLNIPTIPIIVVHMNRSGDAVNISFEMNSGEGFSCMTPFGGGHNPMNQVKEAIEKLCKFF